MKKSFAFILVALSLQLSFNAQNILHVTLTQDLCLDHLTIVFENDDVQELDLGCQHEYNFNFGDKVVESVIINNVSCAPGSTTDVRVNNDVPAKARRARFSQVGTWNSFVERVDIEANDPD